MTLTLALRTALSGLSATQSALQVTSSNITNVNTEGYSRKDVTFSTRTVSGTGAEDGSVWVLARGGQRK